ncbi:AraC family transcriptional regulator [Caproiciproducens sp. NJN-50]|uniref:AraC family transcriptional regulator n=1 Tax=Acutalibacteraceae TaxID=3082771 RepID=UPI000FFE0208|nr:MULTISPECIES: AraC family transcriptional regulator [Acutalibacteraceae]QAT49563.1 AraC family transcriptional regulator [Caproiciproducens sp. NJN-50]
MGEEEFRRSFRDPFHNSLGLAVYSCGVQRCASCHSWGPAVRDHYLIHYILSGRGTFRCSGKQHRLSVGDGFLVVPSQLVSYAADGKEPWTYCWVGFNGSDAKRLMEQTGLLDREPVFHYEGDDRLERLLTGICNSSGSSPSEEARMESGLLLFLAELMDRFGKPAQPQDNGYEYVKKAIKFIDYNYSGDITVSSIASNAGISRSHLYRLFMRHISMPPNEYLMRYRVGKAAELLAAGDLTVGETAYSTGFSDQLYFSRVFRRYMGIPPSRYALGRGKSVGKEKKI